MVRSDAEEGFLTPMCIAYRGRISLEPLVGNRNH